MAEDREELLRFLREENAAYREAIRADGDASRKLLLDTIKFISIPMTLLLGIAVFLGWRSFSDVQATIIAEARRETQAEVSRMQGEIRERLSDQFKTPVLQQTVKQAAKESTEQAAAPLIKAEVTNQVKRSVELENGTIRETVTQQTQTAVKQMGTQIDGMVKQAVEKKVANDVQPVIDQVGGLKSKTELQLLILRMNADDATAFDTLVAMPVESVSPEYRDVLIGALRTVFQDRNSGIYTARSFEKQPTDGELVGYLSSPDLYQRQAALDTLQGSKKEDLFPKGGRNAAIRSIHKRSRCGFPCIQCLDWTEVQNLR